LGAAPLAGEIAALARRARIAIDRQPDAPAETPGTVGPRLSAEMAVEPARDGAGALREAGLSDREVEVLRLVVAGRTNGQIADRLFITRKTAGVHVTHILDKLGVANRVEAAMVAARLGLEPDDDER
jgi:DNA-binding NarL/FixJ family response regulator